MFSVRHLSEFNTNTCNYIQGLNMTLVYTFFGFSLYNFFRLDSDSADSNVVAFSP